MYVIKLIISLIWKLKERKKNCNIINLIKVLVETKTKNGGDKFAHLIIDKCHRFVQWQLEKIKLGD